MCPRAQSLEPLGVEDRARKGRRAVRVVLHGAARLALLPAVLLEPLHLLAPEQLPLHLLRQPALGRQLVEAGAGEHEAAAGGQQLWVGSTGAISVLRLHPPHTRLLDVP